ncbi:Agglutinin-like protein, putative (Cell surface glycoprotein, putative), partial [Candida maltosa Xu316]
MILFKLIFFLALLHCNYAREINGVFNSFNSLTWDNGSNRRYRAPFWQTWNANFGWRLDGSTAQPGDSFSLFLPCVNRFLTSQEYVDLTADGVSYARCYLNSAEVFVTSSSLGCVVTNALSDNLIVSGSLSVPIVWNSGGSGNARDLECASMYTAGNNQVVFNDGVNSLTQTANFEGTTEPIDDSFRYARQIPSLSKVQAYVLAPNCANGYSNGVLGMSATGDGFQFDCSSVTTGITDRLNAWLFPTTSSSFSYRISCSRNEVKIEYQNIPRNFRPFLSAIFQTPPDQSTLVRYNIINQCVGSRNSVDSSRSTNWSPYRSENAVSEGVVILVTTKYGTASTTVVTTLPFSSGDRTKTIEVLEPIPRTTITTSYLGRTTSYDTVTGSMGNIISEIVNSPFQTTTTVTSYWTGSVTSTTTVIDLSTPVDTVIVQVPSPNPTTTVTSFWTGTTPLTRTYTNPPLNTDTVLVEEPPNPTTTLTTWWTGVRPSTELITNGPSSTDTNLVLEPRNPTTTTTIFWTGSYQTTVIRTNGPRSTDTEIRVYPRNPTTTVTTFWTGSTANTVTRTNSPQNTDTVFVQQPRNPTTTITTFGTNSNINTITRTNGPLSTDTVIVQAPRNPTTTVTTFWTGISEVRSTRTNGPLQTDTVLVQVPNNPTVTTTVFGSVATPSTTTISTGPLGTDTVVVVQPPNPTVITTIFGSVTAPSTTTITTDPLGTDSVIVQVPNNPTVTTTIFGSITVPTTQTITQGPL